MKFNFIGIEVSIEGIIIVTTNWFKMIKHPWPVAKHGKLGSPAPHFNLYGQLPCHCSKALIVIIMIIIENPFPFTSTTQDSYKLY